jgi:hypothetical protein
MTGGWLLATLQMPFRRAAPRHSLGAASASGKASIAPARKAVAQAA